MLLSEVTLLLVSAAEQAPEPEDVKAGWTAFAIFIGLIVVVGLLGFSLSRHLRRAEFNERVGQRVGKTQTGRGGQVVQNDGAFQAESSRMRPDEARELRRDAQSCAQVPGKRPDVGSCLHLNVKQGCREISESRR